jgi:hypothetical protein
VPPRRNLLVLIACAAFMFVTGLAALASAFAEPKFCCGLGRDTTKNTMKALHAVAEAWRVNHGNECPTPQRLKEDKELAASTDVRDAWAEPYEIRCDGEATTVISSGPDRRKGTTDDITFPERTVSGPDLGTWDGR